MNTHLMLIVDRSGSMAAIQDDTIGGIRALIKELAEDETPTYISYALFDDVDSFDLVIDRVLAADVREDDVVLAPRGMTPLLDAAGRAVTHAREHEHEFENTMLAIVTDGQENASKEFTLETLRESIEAAEKDGWLVTFMGANIDAFAVGSSFGASHTVTYAANSDSVLAGYAQTSSVLRGANRRARRNGSMSFASVEDGEILTEV